MKEQVMLLSVHPRVNLVVCPLPDGAFSIGMQTPKRGGEFNRPKVIRAGDLPSALGAAEAAMGFAIYDIDVAEGARGEWDKDDPDYALCILGREVLGRSRTMKPSPLSDALEGAPEFEPGTAWRWVGELWESVDVDSVLGLPGVPSPESAYKASMTRSGSFL